MVASLAIFAKEKKTNKKRKKKKQAFFPPTLVEVRDFVHPHLRGYLRCATQILMGAYNTLANIVAAQRDSLAVILLKRNAAKGHFSC